VSPTLSYVFDTGKRFDAITDVAGTIDIESPSSATATANIDFEIGPISYYCPLTLSGTPPAMTGDNASCLVGNNVAGYAYYGVTMTITSISDTAIVGYIDASVIASTQFAGTAVVNFTATPQQGGGLRA
jgi:hypothetical protein